MDIRRLVKSFDFIKESYTIDDVNKILDEMKKIEENKKLVKEW